MYSYCCTAPTDTLLHTVVCIHAKRMCTHPDYEGEPFVTQTTHLGCSKSDLVRHRHGTARLCASSTSTRARRWHRGGRSGARRIGDAQRHTRFHYHHAIAQSGWFIMGLFSSSNAAASSSKAPEAAALPTRTARQECWASRDAYYQCLTSKNIIVPPGTDMGDGRSVSSKAPPEEKAKVQDKARRQAEALESDPCKTLRSDYEGHCAKSWVRFADRRGGKRRVKGSFVVTPLFFDLPWTDLTGSDDPTAGGLL